MNIKINKKCRLLYILLACFLLFGFIFLPFQRNVVSADELSPDNLSESSCNYLYDLQHLVISSGGSYIDIDYPSPIYPEKLQYYYDNNISNYYNKRAYGFIVNNQLVEQFPSFDIRFGAGSDNLIGMSQSLFPNSSVSNYLVDYYKSNSFIPLSGKNVNGRFYLDFGDSVIPIGRTHNDFVLNNWQNKSFNIYIIADRPHTLKITTSYQCYYNTTNAPGSAVTVFKNLNVSDTITYEYTYNSNSNNVSGGACIFADSSLDNYYIYSNFQFYYRYFTNMRVEVEVIADDGFANLNQISFTNYSYVLPSDVPFNFSTIFSNIYSNPDFAEPDFSSWLGTAVSGFLDTELIPGFTFAGLLAVVIAIPLVLTLLKYFAGG